MSICVPSNKVKQFASKYINILKKFGELDYQKVSILTRHSVKTLGAKEAARFVYNYFPSNIVQKMLEANYGSAKSDIQVLNDDNFDKIVVADDDTPWLIKFYSNKCSHCVEFQPTWQKVPNVVSGVHLGEVSLDQGHDLLKRFNVESLPHIMLLKDGKQYALVNGSYTIENILDFLQRPETYNDRPDDEIDCSNTIKGLIRMFSQSGKQSSKRSHKRSHKRSSTQSQSHKRSSKQSRRRNRSATIQ